MKNLILFIAVLFFFSCKDIKEVTIENIQSVQATGISLQSIRLKVGAKINNPNDFKFTLKDIDVHVFVKGIDFGEAAIDAKEAVAANSNEVHYFYVETNPTKLFFQAMPLMSSLSNHEPMNVKMKGRVKVRAFGVSKWFPLEMEQEIKVL